MTLGSPVCKGSEEQLHARGREALLDQGTLKPSQMPDVEAATAETSTSVCRQPKWPFSAAHNGPQLQPPSHPGGEHSQQQQQQYINKELEDAIDNSFVKWSYKSQYPCITEGCHLQLNALP